MTSLMTSQGPDPLSVRNTNFPKVGDHRVKISAQSDKKCRRRSILKKMLDDVISDVTRSGSISVRTTNFPQVGDHRVKKLAQSDKN